MSKINASMEVLFGAHRQGVANKTGKPYNFIEVSNGFEAKLFNTSLPTEDTRSLVKGDSVVCDVEIDVFTGKTTITGVR